MNAWQDFFEHSTDAVFGIDENRKIRFWNSNCVRLLGLSREAVLGKDCGSVLCGTDLRGGQFCGAQCPVRKEGVRMANGFDLVVKRPDAVSVLCSVGVLRLPGEARRQPDGARVYLSMRDASCQRLLQRLAGEQNGWSKAPSRHKKSMLTEREVEILRLAAQGTATARIASSLHISAATVRNHFRNIFARLEVHTRAEAVGHAMRHGLL